MLFTPEHDAKIRELYTPPYVRGRIAHQARRWNCKVNDIVHRRDQLGIQALCPQGTRKPWGADEIELLNQNPHLTHHDLRLLMRRNGFERTANAIQILRFRQGWRNQVERDEVTAGYTCNGLADLMGVSSRTVWRWIKQGQLKAKKEGGDQRCDCYRIAAKSVRHFMQNYISLWEPGKVDKYWLMDILTKAN